MPPTLRLWRAEKREGGFVVDDRQDEIPRYAFLAARACDLHAIAVQDRVFQGGPHVDRTYQARREQVFTVAVNWAEAGGTCFCVSMGCGPKATQGFDLALSEVLDGARHYFVVETGSTLGAAVLSEVPHREARQEEAEKADEVVARNRRRMAGAWIPVALKSRSTKISSTPGGRMSRRAA